jgi:hypothetical protein
LIRTSGQNKAAKNEPEVGCHMNNNFFISHFQVLDHFLHLQHFAEEKNRTKFDTYSRRVQRSVAQPRRHKYAVAAELNGHYHHPQEKTQPN